MERRFEEDKAVTLALCEVSPQLFTGVDQRLAKFVGPLAELLSSGSAWTHDEIPARLGFRVRDAQKGPLQVEVTTCRVRAKYEKRAMKYDETLVIVRSLGEDGGRRSTITTSPMHRAKRRSRSLPAWRCRHIASKKRSNVARTKQGWRSTKCGRGEARITIMPFR